VSETERADEIARGPRRRLLGNIALVAALALGLAGVVLGWHQLSERAESAETSAVSLAEQVQKRCDEMGSLRVGDRELCKQAEEVAEDPGVATAPAAGRDGVDGTDGRDGTDGEDGRDGKPGEPGKDGKDGRDGRPGEPGADGEPGTDGADGSNGIDGAPGRGIQSMQCATGGWIIQYADGLAASDPGPCRGPQGEPGADGKDGADGEDGVDGKDGTARPGTYACPEGQFATGFAIATDGAVTLTCADLITP
jgi:hypothetical protein